MFDRSMSTTVRKRAMLNPSSGQYTETSPFPHFQSRSPGHIGFSVVRASPETEKAQKNRYAILAAFDR
jgi:hypothetical protein